MQFCPFVLDREQKEAPVVIRAMLASDAEQTNMVPKWQTSWTSEFLTSDRFEKYAVKCGEELVALGAYEVLDTSLIVHIVYIEAQPESNPTMVKDEPKYTGIGQLLIAFGIKLSIDYGFAGDVVLEAKTTQLAEHYIRDFGAVKLPTFGSAPRLLIADDAAKQIFFRYLR